MHMPSEFPAFFMILSYVLTSVFQLFFIHVIICRRKTCGSFQSKREEKFYHIQCSTLLLSIIAILIKSCCWYGYLSILQILGRTLFHCVFHKRITIMKPLYIIVLFCQFVTTGAERQLFCSSESISVWYSYDGKSTRAFI